MSAEAGGSYLAARYPERHVTGPGSLLAAKMAAADFMKTNPNVKIEVLGPPPTSGTRDSLVELYLEKGCNTDPAMEALKAQDEDRHKQVCTQIREDGAYIEAGENDNLLVQKVAANPGAVGVLGFSFVGIVLLYALQRIQAVLPFDFGTQPADLDLCVGRR